MRIFWALLFLTVFFCIPVRADVYSLWPFSGTSAGGDNASELLSPKKFWQENIRVNGSDVRLDVALPEVPFADAVALFRKRYPDAQFSVNSNSLLMNMIRKDGSMQRLYLLNLRGVNPLLQFSMEIPANRREASDADWPRELPVFSGAEHRMVMFFPARNATFASYIITNATRPQLVSEISSRLRADGWEPASQEIADPFKATGEVFMKESPLRILLFGTAETSREGGVMVSFYTRPLGK